MIRIVLLQYAQRIVTIRNAPFYVFVLLQYDRTLTIRIRTLTIRIQCSTICSLNVSLQYDRTRMWLTTVSLRYDVLQYGTFPTIRFVLPAKKKPIRIVSKWVFFDLFGSLNQGWKKLDKVRIVLLRYSSYCRSTNVLRQYVSYRYDTQRIITVWFVSAFEFFGSQNLVLKNAG